MVRATSGVAAPRGAKTAFYGAFAHDAPSGNRRRKTLELTLSEVDRFEQPGGEPPRAFRHDDAVGLGEGLQPGGEIGRLADDGLLLRGAFADEIADHDEAGGDPDARRERIAARRCQPDERRDR